MFPKRKVNRKRRVAKRRVPRRKIGGTGSKGIEKVYTYTQTLNQSYILNSLTGPGIPAVSALSFPIQPTNISATATASKTGFAGYYDFGVGAPFALTDLANYTAYTGIYDNYKILSVTLELEFMSNNATVAGSSVMPTVYALQDHDDVRIPTKISDVTGHQGHKRFKFGDKSRSCFRITCKPRVAVPVYNADGALSPPNLGYQQGQGWQDCVFPNNQYNGLKLWFTDVLLPGTTEPQVNSAFRCKWTYRIAYKGSLNSF